MMEEGEMWLEEGEIWLGKEQRNVEWKRVTEQNREKEGLNEGKIR
jgi:hypothetical protein